MGQERNSCSRSLSATSSKSTCGTERITIPTGTISHRDGRHVKRHQLHRANSGDSLTLSSTFVLPPHDLRPLVHLGIDLGGTSLRIGAFDANMQLLARHVMPTRVSAGPRAVIGDMSDAVFSLLDETGGHTESIGLGSPGPLNLLEGTLGQLPNFPGWDFFPLRSSLEELTGLPVVLDGDANAAALGELKLGARR